MQQQLLVRYLIGRYDYSIVRALKLAFFYRVEVSYESNIRFSAIQNILYTLKVVILQLSHRNIKEFYEKWVLSPDRKNRLLTIISLGLGFLIPYLGWNPLLILLIVNAYLSYKEAEDKKIRFLYVLITVIISAMISFSFICWFS